MTIPWERLDKDELRHALDEIRSVLDQEDWRHITVYKDAVEAWDGKPTGTKVWETEKFVDEVCPPELLDCPHCGQGGIGISEDGAGIYYVQCQNCLARSVNSRQEASVVAAWNRRYPQEVPDDAERVG